MRIVNAINRSINKQGLKVLILIRMQPFINKGFLNYILGCCKITACQFFIASGIGQIPMTVTFIYIGVTFKDFQELVTGSTKLNKMQVASLSICMAALIIMLIMITRESKK